jgi:hypothetical protein
MWGRRETAGQSWWSLITLGEQMRERETGYFALSSLVMQRDLAASSAGSSIPFSPHQGEREKNEYLYDGKNTGELPESKQIKL